MAYTTINKSTDYFNTKLWSGNGSSQALTGVGHQTDMAWIKSRTDTRKHNMYDVVRGVQKRIVPNDTVAEDTVPGVTAFGTDGFTVGSETDTNGSSRNFVGWSWSAGASAGSSNSVGSINSTVSANTTAGFSIVKYTGTGSAATVGHGLGAVPKMFITKKLNTSESWGVYHNTQGAGKFLRLEGNNAVDTSTTVWNNTTPTSSVFSIGTGGISNTSGQDYIAYCFAEKTGYSKFGSYTGNGNVDGTFIYLGFKPAFIIIKKSSATQSWTMQDNKRNPINNGGDMTALKPNSNGAEEDEASHRIDYLSNGFKMRYNWEGNNQSGATYIYMAFAENPIVGSNNIPATAR